MNLPRIIIVNGGYRTGSTVVYNLARQLLHYQVGPARVRQENLPARLIDELVEVSPELLVPGQHWLIKCHNYLPPPGAGDEGVAYLFTHRETRSTAASMLRMGFPPAKLLAYLAENHRTESSEWSVRQKSRLLPISHQEIRDQLGLVVRWVHETLGMTLVPEQLAAIAHDLSLPVVRSRLAAMPEGLEADPATEFRRNHITDEGTETVLPGWLEEFLAGEQPSCTND